MSISSAWDLSSDAELITAVRSGESDAFGVLYERHSTAARAVARQYSNSPADAEDAVADAFSRVFSAVQAGGGPDVAFRAYLFTVVRRVAMTRIESGRRAIATDDLETFESAAGPGESTEEPAMAGFERGIVSQAYKSLPERWQAVLWYTEVEELNPAQIAPILGLTANGVAALAYRAREGLRQAYLQQHLAAPMGEACTIVNGKLGAYVRGGLAKRETALVESHLEECGACRALVLELGDVNHGMRVVIGPLVLGTVGLAVLKGLGFGGVAGAVGVGVGAGAGSGAAFGSGMGAGAGAGSAASAGAGASVGVGSAAASGMAASGLVVAGAGAATLAAPAASASTATTGTGLAATAGAGVTGGAAGAAAAAGGLSALIAGIPVGVLGLVAAGVVVAATVGVAGLMGTFSSDDPEAGATPVAGVVESAAPDDLAAGTDDEAPQDVVAAPEASTPPDASDPTNIPEGDQTVDPEASDGSATPAEEAAPTVRSADPRVAPPVVPATPAAEPVVPPVGEPVVPPVVPPVGEPVAPPVVPAIPPAPQVHAVPPAGLVLTAGLPGITQVTVSNTGGVIAGQVLTEFIFEPGVQWEVAALGVLPAGAGAGLGGVRTAEVPSSAWTCAPSSNDVATCTLADLPIGATSTLIVSILVNAPDLDGDSSLAVGVVTWSPDRGGVRPVPAVVVTRVSSPPAQLVAGPVEGQVDTLVAGAPQTVAIPVTNTGGTTAVGVRATVDLPADVFGAAGAPWSCTPSATGDLDCTLATLARRGGSEPLRLTLTADSALRNQARAGEVLSVTFAGPGITAVTVTSEPVQVRSAAARYTLVAGAVQPVKQGAEANLPTTLSNVGGTDGADLTVRAALPAGIDGIPGGGWQRCSISLGRDMCLTVPTAPVDASAALPPLTVKVLESSAVGARSVTFTATDPATDPDGVRATATATLTVVQVQVHSATVTGQAATLDQGQDGTLFFEIKNTGTTTLTGLSARLSLDPSMHFVDGSGLDRWNCDDEAVCALTGTLLPGRSTILSVVVNPSSHTEGKPPFEVTATLTGTGLAEVSGTAMVTVTKD